MKKWWIVFIVLALVLYILPNWGMITSDFIQGDSIEYKWSVMVAQGQSIYPYEEEFVGSHTCVYTPLYFLLLGGLLKVFGLSVIVGKWFSVFLVVGVALFAYLISRRLSGRYWLSLIAVVLVFLHPSLGIQCIRDIKIDQLGLFLSVVGVYLSVRGKYWWAIPFYVLAFFTKQSFLAAPLATSLYLWFKVNRKEALAYSGVTLGVAIFGLLVGQWLTDFQFWTHITTFAMDTGEVRLLNTLVGLGVSIGFMGLPFSLAVFYLGKYRDFNLVSVYFLSSLLILLGTIGKVESGINYSFEVVTSASILSVLAVSRVLGGRKVQWK